MRFLFPMLSSSLQTRLAQHGLGTNRAAVLAALPPPAATKGRPTPWATYPAPELLRAVLHFAGQPATARVGRMLLRGWYQKKTELRARVYHALCQQGYPLPPLAALPLPCPWQVRLANDDVAHCPPHHYFAPRGQLLTDTAGGPPEEVTLMAHLLGWSVRPVAVGETPPDADDLKLVAAAYNTLQHLDLALARYAGPAPPPLPPGADTGQLQAVVASLYPSVREMTSNPPALVEPPTRDALADVVAQLEQESSGRYVTGQRRTAAVGRLARVLRLRHRQHPDFGPLAGLHGQAQALLTAFATRWPTDPDEPDCTDRLLTLGDDGATALLAQAQPYHLLLHLAEHPDELALVDEQSADYQALEAAVAPALLNALLLGKLTLAPDP